MKRDFVFWGVILVLLGILLMLSIRESSASQLEEDIAQSMYFRRSSYVETDQRLAQFKEESKQRELIRIREAREKSMKQELALATNRENEEYKDIAENIPTIERGRTTKADILEMMRHPELVMDPSRPYLVAPWRMNQYFRAAGYPYPGKSEKVLGASYFYTEITAPRIGFRRDLLVTINKATKLVDYSRDYLDTGYIQKYYWFVE